MKKILTLILLSTFLFTSCSKKREGKPRVLVFYKTAGFVHASIPLGIAAIKKLGVENDFVVDTTKDAAQFNDDTLRKYSAIIFLNTTGNVLNYKQEPALERYIQAGGGFVGIHAATDTEYDWMWYGRLVGAYFSSHPKPQQARFVIKDNSFKATKHFTDSVWQRTDELYNFKKINPDIHVLMTIDEHSYEGGTNGKFHPMAWYHNYDGGRSFYTALGHTDESYSEENYLKLLLGGIQYAIGDNLELNYSKAKSQYPPDEDRFTKTQLVTGEFYEPTEMTILPNFDILIAQRRGELMLYKNETKKVKKVGFLNVYAVTHTPGVNAEEGFLGLAKDPNYAKNNWIYIYYSPADSSVNRLSRFTFKNDTLDRSTEKTILEVKSQREICCHTGGSIAFGGDGLLYLSTGDNSTPFDEKGAKYVNSGYAPLNDLPGRKQFDARRSSGNTNDLRGKILRIRMKDDATYEIPEGNLFPKGTDKTRPEIYTMGHRNPYRISVDQKNNILYWGEVGPDANVDSLATRGPRGYDELNQARKPGFFGWPLFIGDNYPYHAYDYATGKSGAPFDVQKPINDSRNNTGLRELPAVSAPFIWYPYGESAEFPQVGTGGRNAMAGPVYYTDMYPKETRLPDYYNGKMIFYEWMRGFIMMVSLQPNGDYDKMEPFFPKLKMNSVIDMEAGPDGRLYLLEYGSGWFTKNDDAGLARIDYNAGNLPPRIGELTINKTSGVLPLTIEASISSEDPEKKQMTYLWTLTNGNVKETKEPKLTYTFNEVGDYPIFVEVKDSEGGSSKSNVVNVYAGNEIPQVNIRITEGNKSFYLPGEKIGYTVDVTDNDASIDPANLFVSVEYVEGFDKAATTLGHQQGQMAISGKSLTQSLDCKICHKENGKSIGPSFIDVAKKYQNNANASGYLASKIVKGGSGVWGDVAMAAHPTLADKDVQQMVTYILGLAGTEAQKKSLPATGSITPPTNLKPNATLVLSASYTDKGGQNIKALTGSNSISLGSSTISLTEIKKLSGFASIKYGGRTVLFYPKSEGWLGIEDIDLTNVKSLMIVSGWQEVPKTALRYDIRLDDVKGKSIGSGILPVQKSGAMGMSIIPLNHPRDGKKHTIYIIAKPEQTIGFTAAIASIQFNK
ncbi:MAG: ThuA domain-containing protein [Bacteroidetes bacterium]|nr:ThuA domain-containing protein [Bacteroidota bacterium]MBS1541319.1 ThuA domain-containing protein [Bacteroidota bacterium]